MASIKVCDLILKASTQLHDLDTLRRWPRTDLQRYLNEAYSAVIAVRPDANMQSAVVDLVEGVSQDLTDPDSINLPAAVKLFGVIRNATAATKRAIRQIPSSVLDTQLPDWRDEEGSTAIEYFMDDPLDPCSFDVYPPAAVGAKVEVQYSAMPEPHELTDSELDINGSEEVIRIGAEYEPALLDYVLYRAYDPDSEVGDASKSAQHYSAFREFLTEKTKIDVALAGGGK